MPANTRCPQSVRTSLPLARLAVLLLLVAAIGCADSGSLPQGPPYAAPPAIGTYPAGPALVQSWIDASDRAAIRAHAWDVWASITSQTGQATAPVWETWYSGHEVFEMDPEEDRRQFPDFEDPRQFVHAGSLTAPPIDAAERVTAFNRYSGSLALAIWTRELNRKATLNAINDAFDAVGTPVVDRKLSSSEAVVDASQIVLKPVFQMVSASEPTAIPYWAGVEPGTTTNLLNPEPHTWKQCVAIDPTGALAPGETIELPCNGLPAELTIVAIQDFYFIRLTEAQVNAFTRFGIGSSDDIGTDNLTDPTSVSEMIQPGNLALLVAIHAATKEIENWTWQTFWWAADPEDLNFGADRPPWVQGVWVNYNLRTAYQMLETFGDPESPPLVSFNPYLETNLEGTFTREDGQEVSWTGVTSNCMTCHRLAAWKPNPEADEKGEPNHLTPGYRDQGFIDPADEFIFAGFTKLDFLWSLTRAD